MLIFFEISTLENWPTTMYVVADSTDPLEAPQTLFSSTTALPIIVAGALLCGILMLNLLISAMVRKPYTCVCVCVCVCVYECVLAFSSSIISFSSGLIFYLTPFILGERVQFELQCDEREAVSHP